jgi:signal transduction histidine kinase
MTDSRVFVHDMRNFLGIIIGYSNLLLEELPADDPHRADVDEIRKAGDAALALLDLRAAPRSGEEAK